MAGKYTRARAPFARMYTNQMFESKDGTTRIKIVNQIKRHNVCLNDLLTKFNRTEIQTYKVEERTFGTPCILDTLPFEFTSLKNVFTLVVQLLNSTFLFDLARCTFSTRFVKLHSQTMQFSTRQTNFCTLLCFISFDARTSTLYLTEMRTLHSILTRRISPSPRQISNLTSYIFNLTSYIFNSFFVASSVIVGRDKRTLCGSGRWRPIDLLPWLFSPSCFVKKGVGWQHTTST